uniref:Uncharacterized protein n=1 Tax=Amphimedon queenslandica TaxID=400682 RepID=A0A1X7V521_AMPQE
KESFRSQKINHVSVIFQHLMISSYTSDVCTTFNCPVVEEEMTMHREFNSPKAFDDAKTLLNAICLDVGNRDAPSNMTDEIWNLPPLFKLLFFETAKCCSLASWLQNSGGKNFLLMLLHTMVLGYKQKWRSCISTTTNPVTDWCGYPRKDGEARG